jgi:hypothetical protein
LGRPASEGSKYRFNRRPHRFHVASRFFRPHGARLATEVVLFESRQLVVVGHHADVVKFKVVIGNVFHLQM